MTGISPVIVTEILGLTYFDICNKIRHHQLMSQLHIQLQIHQTNILTPIY